MMVNENGLKEQIEIKENNYQDLIKEIQLKDLQIQSLEKLLQQYQNDKNNDMIFDNEQNEEYKEEDSIVSFAKDNFREMQLNKLINNFDEINNKNINENNDGDNMNNNINNNNNQREPGKIIFNKK